ncbi:MAG: type II secretion system F family protein [Actinomycetota bacterium]
MIGLASGLLAFAGLFAERAIAIARADQRRALLGAVQPEAPDRTGRRIPAWTAALFIAGIAAGIATGPVVAAMGVATVILLRFVLRRRRRAAQRVRATEQLADTVGALSGGLRAGLSLPQSFAYARDEAEEPLRGELEHLVDRIDTGTPFSEALAGWADANASEDARLIVGVLDLHRRSGGDLPTVLDGLAGTLRERRAAQREVRALTAQARLSGVILGMLPLGFFAFLLLTSRREMLDAIGTPFGGTALGIGLGMEALAFVWIRHLLEVR